MDNKKWYKKISTCFWFFMATMPIIIPLIQMIVSTFVHLDSISDISDITNYVNSNNFYSQLSNFRDYMKYLLPDFLFDTFKDLLFHLGIGNIGAQSLGFVCAWFVWAYVIELMVDFVVWLPKLIHSFIERWN